MPVRSRPVLPSPLEIGQRARASRRHRRGAVCRDHDGAQVAKVDLVDGGQRGVSPVAPLRRSQTRPELLREREQLLPLMAVSPRSLRPSFSLSIACRTAGMSPANTCSAIGRCSGGNSSSTADRWTRAGRRRFGFGFAGSSGRGRDGRRSVAQWNFPPRPRRRGRLAKCGRIEVTCRRLGFEHRLVRERPRVCVHHHEGRAQNGRVDHVDRCVRHPLTRAVARGRRSRRSRSGRAPLTSEEVTSCLITHGSADDLDALGFVALLRLDG